MATSRRAASGGTRVARIAGMTAAISVTTRPMAKAMTTVDGLTTSDVVGRSAPDASSSGGDALGQQHAGPEAEERPRSRPTRTASSITEPSTWRAARADGSQERQLAGALRDEDREGVGDDEDADEQGDAAEDRQRLLEEGEALLHVGGDLGGGLLAGEHLGVVRHDLAMASASCCWLTPSSAPASTVWIRPSVPAIRCTSASVSSTETVPAELSAVPKSTVPTSV